MSYDTDKLLEMDELTIETANLIRKGMQSDKAIEKARNLLKIRKEKHNQQINAD